MGIESQNVCRYHKFGYCKFKTSCKFKHVTVVCDDDRCKNQHACQKRHPRVCKYFINFGSCKLGSACAYAHQTRRKVENGRIEQKLDELMRIIKEKDEIIDELVVKNKEKDGIIEKLVENVKNLTIEVKKLKDTKMQISSVEVVKNVTLEENENSDNIGSSVVLNDEASVEKKAKEFINKNLQHLNEIKNEVKKSRKNSKGVREKIKALHSKMKDEVKNCDLDSGSSQRHYDCCLTLNQFEDQIETWIETNDKEEFFNTIEEFITEFDDMLNQV